MKKKPLCISYLRYSSNRQSKGTSIERQLELSEQWAARNGYVIDDALRETGISAYRGKNAKTGKLASLLKRIDSGEIPPGSVIICENLDRLSRQEANIATEMLLGIINRGVKIATVGDDERIYETPCDLMDMMYLVMSVSRSNQESARKGELAAKNWRIKREKAKSGEALLSTKLPCWLTLDAKRRIVIDKPKAAAVRKCFELAMKGFGVGAIVRKLNADGVPPPAGGNLWYTRFVWRLFREEAVIGVKVTKRFDSGTRIPVDKIDGYYPALVTAATYASVGAMMSGRRNRKYGHRESKTYTNIFRDILKDENGNSFSLISRRSGEKQMRYLVSLGPWSKKVGEAVYVREDVFTQAFIEVFCSHFPEALDQQRDDDGASELDEALGRMHKLDKTMEELEDAFVDDLASAPVKLRMLAKLQAKRDAEAERVRQAQQSSALATTSTLDDAIERLRQLLTGELKNEHRIEVSGIIRRYVESMKLVTESVELDSEGPKLTKKLLWLVGNVHVNLRGGGSLRYVFKYPNTKSARVNKLASLEVQLR